MTTDECIVVVVSDLHAGSTVGLCPFSFEHEGGVHRANAAQKWLWRNWKDFWEVVSRLRDDTKLPLVTIVNGDATDRDHHGTTELITRNEADLLNLAFIVLEPAVAVSDAMIMVRGTAVHSGESAWMEEKVAQDIAITEWHSDQQASWWHLYGEFGGVVFDAQHHPEAGGSRPWTSGNAANLISSFVLEEYARSGDRIPDVALRAHTHQFQTSGVNRYPFVIFTPPWQVATSYVNGPVAAAGKINSVGGLYFICRNGAYTWEKVVYIPRRDKPRRIQWTGQ